jgi:hypothetical protein
MIMGEILLLILTTGGISYLNKQYAVVCEACRQPYASKALSFS